MEHDSEGARLLQCVCIQLLLLPLALFQSVTPPVRVIVSAALLLLYRGSLLGGGRAFLQRSGDDLTHYKHVYSAPLCESWEEM